MAKTAIQALLWANPKSIANSYEQVFYDDNATLFHVKTSLYNENRSIFDMIKSVAVLRGLLNRDLIRNEVDMFPLVSLANKNVQSAILMQLPHFDHDGHKIYIPTYSVEANDIFANHLDLLKKEKNEYLNNNDYDIVNPFTTYGFSLLSSSFTRLIPLDVSKDDVRAFYHDDFETLFFIHKDCTLEAELPLFDEKITRLNQIDLFKRLNKAANSYFNEDTISLFNCLKENGLLSSNCVEECLHEHAKYLKRKN